MESIKSKIMFSVIIVAHNEEKSIIRCIENVNKHINERKDIEIIVVDDASNDSTLKHISLSDVTVLTSKRKNGISQCRNDGVNIAKGEYLLFLDAHSYLTGENVFTQIQAIFEKEPNIVGISGSYKSLNYDDLNIIRDLVRDTFRYKQNQYLRISNKKFSTFSSCIGCLKREALTIIQFPKHFKNGADEDLLLQLVLMDKGYEFLHINSIRCWHDARVSRINLLNKIIYNERGFNNLMVDVEKLSLENIPYSPYLLDFSFSFFLLPILIGLNIIYPFILVSVILFILLFIIDFYKLVNLYFSNSCSMKLKMAAIGYILVKEYVKTVYFYIYLIKGKYTFKSIVYSLNTYLKWELKKLYIY